MLSEENVTTDESHQKLHNSKLESPPPKIFKTVIVHSRTSDKCSLFKYEGANNECITIPIHPKNILYHEHYRQLNSLSPNRLIFRFIGTQPETGETFMSFGHYKQVTCIDFTRQFTSIQCIFQIASQLPSLRDVQISLNQDNLPLTDEELLLLKKQKKQYKSHSVKQLTINISRWNDKDKVASISYRKLRLDPILDYAKLCFRKLESIKIVNDENRNSSLCYSILSSFRENLHRQFMNDTSNTSITFTTLPKKKSPCGEGNSSSDSSRRKSRDEEKAVDKRQEATTTTTSPRDYDEDCIPLVDLCSDTHEAADPHSTDCPSGSSPSQEKDVETNASDSTTDFAKESEGQFSDEYNLDEVEEIDHSKLEVNEPESTPVSTSTAPDEQTKKAANNLVIPTSTSNTTENTTQNKSQSRISSSTNSNSRQNNNRRRPYNHDGQGHRGRSAPYPTTRNHFTGQSHGLLGNHPQQGYLPRLLDVSVFPPQGDPYANYYETENHWRNTQYRNQ